MQARSAPGPVIATKAAMGAADPAKDLTMTTDHDDTEFEPPHSSSPTDHVLNELQLYGYRPFQDEPDPRPLPEGNAVAGAVADIFDALISTLGDLFIWGRPFCWERFSRIRPLCLRVRRAKKEQPDRSIRRTRR